MRSHVQEKNAGPCRLCSSKEVSYRELRVVENLDFRVTNEKPEMEVDNGDGRMVS